MCRKMEEQLADSYRGGRDTRSIAERLEALKEQGCVTFVTGEAPPTAMQVVCRRMLGDPNLDRKRLLVTFRRGVTPGNWLPADLTEDHHTVDVRDRSAAVREVAERYQRRTGGPTNEDDHLELAKQHLDAVAGDVVDVAADLLVRRPGRLRVAVLRPDHLFPSPRRQSLEMLEDFVARLRTLMQQFGGMAVLVVPSGDDERIANEIRERVDVQFEVRKQPSFVEQRVTLAPGTEESLRSEWHQPP